MYRPLTLLAMLGAIVGVTISSVLFKLAAEQKSTIIFVLGVIIGFSYPVCITFALRGNDPILVYSTVGGLGAIAFYITLYKLFGQPLSAWQWGGILLIALGEVFLVIPRGSPDETPGSSAPTAHSDP